MGGLCLAFLYCQNGKPIEPIDLTTHNCLQYAYQTTGATDWQFKGKQGDYIVKVSGSFSTDNATALRKAALGGHGIAYVPRCLVYHDIRSGELVDIFPELVGKSSVSTRFILLLVSLQTK